MRTYCFLTALVVLSFARAASADDNAETKPILDKAIKALGGEERLGKIKALAWHRKLKLLPPPDTRLTSTERCYVQSPGRFRYEFEGEEPVNKRHQTVTVVDGNRGWKMKYGRTEELDKKELAHLKRHLAFELSMRTLQPLKDKAIKLSPAGEAKVDNRPAVGIQVTSPGEPVYWVYFDKVSGLPVKHMEKESVDSQELISATLFGDYKEVEGIKVAMKLSHRLDDSFDYEEEIIDLKFLDKLDDKLFAKP
jgi:hypothetical protein